MEKDIQVGAEGSLKLIQLDGKIQLVFAHKHASGEVQLSVIEDEKYFIDQLLPLVPSWAQYGLKLAEAALP